MARIAINGFGRIGRLFFRQAFGVKDIEIVAVNDLGNVENFAYLLQHDSVYGAYSHAVHVESSKTGSALSVDGTQILF